jgi:hypothetical protein
VTNKIFLAAYEYQISKNKVQEPKKEIPGA